MGGGLLPVGQAGTARFSKCISPAFLAASSKAYLNCVGVAASCAFAFSFPSLQIRDGLGGWGCCCVRGLTDLSLAK